jgi:RNA polymerase sigma factor (sigma-70 family)
MSIAPTSFLEIEVAESDFDLLNRFRERGDQEAFTEIVRRYATAVFATCMRILGDRARADDVSQETFFKLSQRPDAVKQSLGGWLHTAATRLSIDAVRSDASRAQREATYEPRPSSSETLQWQDVSPHVDEALAELPEEYRALLVRHFLQGKSQCSLANELSTSPATISRRIKTGVDMLRTQLKRRGVTVGALVLLSMLRDHTFAAAPLEMYRELGKIAMLAGKTTTPAPPPPWYADGVSAFFGKVLSKCGVWWVTCIASLAIAYGALTMLAFPQKNAAATAPATTNTVAPRREPDMEYYRDQRQQALRKAGLTP